jgi:hypothetical protein
MKTKTFHVGQEVYLPSLRQFGRVHLTNAAGEAVQVKIKTPDGDKIINTLNMIVTIVSIVEKGLLPLLKAIVMEIKSWFS